MSFQKKNAHLSLQHFVPSFEQCRVCFYYARIDGTQMTFPMKARALLTDSHFLVPLIVFLIGLALLISLH